MLPSTAEWGSIPAWAGEPHQDGVRHKADTVYPRVGGGTFYIVDPSDGSAGLSPRGRGNLVSAVRPSGMSRSIPAWAGEPQADSSKPNSPMGLSPRGRGNLCLAMPQSRVHRARSIPAWAGEPRRIGGRRDFLGERVYPRVGGGTRQCRHHLRRASGLSPRGRGNPGHLPSNGLHPGSIPAWAGEPGSGEASYSAFWVYPRVGGGTSEQWEDRMSLDGLSPRGRGNQILHPAHQGRLGSIPAWAGEPVGEGYHRIGYTVYPRVGGGTVIGSPVCASVYGLSPRGRGNLAPVVQHRLFQWSIPAWAGEPPPNCPTPWAQAVYPRVGGGTSGNKVAAERPFGLSPRGRGNRRLL